MNGTEALILDAIRSGRDFADAAVAGRHLADQVAGAGEADLPWLLGALATAEAHRAAADLAFSAALDGLEASGDRDAAVAVMDGVTALTEGVRRRNLSSYPEVIPC